jgi:two-component system, NarL family, nitrate/nitrite response regulator NarL
MRTLVAADNLLARVGLASVLAGLEPVEIVGQSSLSDSLADDVALYRPEIAVVDLGYGERDTLVRLGMLAEVPVVALIATADTAGQSAAALAVNGAFGLLLRDFDPEALFAALQAVYNGLMVIDPALSSALILSAPNDDFEMLDDLTPRELQVLQLLAEGLPNKQIAQKLAISANTVKFHINAILSKLDAQSRTEAVVRATRAGLIIL